MQDFKKMTGKELTRKLKNLKNGNNSLLEEYPKSKEELETLICELQVHQIELEMQNRELEETRQSLEESRDRYADLYDSAPIIYVTLDQFGYIRELNLTGAHFFRKERSELIGKLFYLFLGAHDRKALLKHLRTCNRLGKKTSGPVQLSVEVSLNVRGRDPVPVQLDSLVLKKENCFRTVILDLTDRKRAEEERSAFLLEKIRRIESEAANQNKDEFLATLSHELRTPLQAILSWVELLQRGSLKPKQQEKGLKIIWQSARAQQQLINDLLDVSRAIAGKLHLDREPVPLERTIQQTLELFDLQIREKGLQVEKQIEKSGLFVSGDPGRLLQITSNLISNALKFTPWGGKITVELKQIESRGEELVQLGVKDSGIGIDAEFLPHMFDRFRQADSSSTRTSPGLGLGLAIVRLLAELHGGSVSADSPGEGKGTHVWVNFPLLKPVDCSDYNRLTFPPTVIGMESHPKLKECRLLLVDDDIVTLATLEAVLQDCGIIVSTASSAQEALKKMILFRPNILVSDIGMPVEDGCSMMKRIRTLRESQGGYVPAIALTAFADPIEQSRALASGFQVYLAKPVPVSTLTQSIADLLDSSRSSVG